LPVAAATAAGWLGAVAARAGSALVVRSGIGSTTAASLALWAGSLGVYAGVASSAATASLSATSSLSAGAALLAVASVSSSVAAPASACSVAGAGAASS
jgi:hypothetical protein